VPDGFWFVAPMVVGLVAASEWARRLAERVMRSPPGGAGEPPGEHARPAQPTRRTRGLRVVALRPAPPADDVIALPQWLEHPSSDPVTKARGRRRPR